MAFTNDVVSKPVNNGVDGAMLGDDNVLDGTGPSKGAVRGDDNGDVRGCKVRKEWCSTHNCTARVMKVSSKKWRWKEKQKLWGFVTVKTSKIACSSVDLRSKGPLSVHKSQCTDVLLPGNTVGGSTGPCVGTVDSYTE